MPGIDVHFYPQEGCLVVTCDEGHYDRLVDVIVADSDVAVAIAHDRSEINSILVERDVVKPPTFRQQFFDPRQLYFFPFLGCALAIFFALFVLAIGLMTLWDWTFGV